MALGPPPTIRSLRVIRLFVAPILVGCFLLARARGQALPYAMGSLVILGDIGWFVIFARRLGPTWRLPPEIARQAFDLPEERPNLQLVDFRLRDGRLVSKQRVMWGEVLAMPFWYWVPPFDFGDVVAVTAHRKRPERNTECGDDATEQPPTTTR